MPMLASARVPGSGTANSVPVSRMVYVPVSTATNPV